MRIFIDPGHGGHDPGAIGHGIKESDIVLKISRKVEKELNNLKDVQVMLSRTSDVFLELKERTDKANAWRADVLVSIHINSFNEKSNGVETFMYTNGSNESLVIASAIQNHLVRETNRYNRGVKKGNLHMVRESKMPSCLVECGFISNKEEATLMKTDNYLDRCADAIVKGLVEVYKLKPKDKNVAVSNDRVRVQTGGLNPQMLKEVAEYFVEKQWYAEITFNFKKGNPTALTGGLSKEMKNDFKEWLEARGWWYKIL